MDAGTEARSRTPRRQGRRWGGDRLRRPHARERPVLPDEDWAARTLWDVENDDENDRTYLFDAGPMDYQCGYCQAFYWHGEKTSKGKFNLCCGGGRLRHLRTASHPQPAFRRLVALVRSDRFKKHARTLNTAYGFARMSTPMGQTHTGQGPRVFVAQGHVYHTTHRPTRRTAPTELGQAFFMEDGEAERVRSRLMLSHVPTDMIACLHETLEEYNPYTRFYRTVRETLLETPDDRVQQLHLKFVTARREPGITGGTENAARSPEVSIVFNDDYPSYHRDLVVHGRTEAQGMVQRVNPMSDHLDALLYPLLFPGGLAGWHAQLEVPTEKRTKYKAITPADFYAYRLMVRPDIDSSLLHHAGKLFQQYLVDVYCRIDFLRVQFYKKRQMELRAVQLKGLVDYVRELDGHRRGTEESTEALGRQVILPASHTGSPRDLRERYLNALAMVQVFGKPDLFVTFTCNPRWPEIRSALMGASSVNDRADIIVRAFNLRFQAFLADIWQRGALGRVRGYSYAIEFQKKGLPHAHLLLILHKKIHRPEQADRIVSAELPDPARHRLLYDLVCEHMMHGPCGDLNPQCPCMEHGRCRYGYPKELCEETFIRDNVFPYYRRRDSAIRTPRGCDNQWVAPYNPALLLRYRCHINIEICTTIHCIKYIYKYVHKGANRALIEARQQQQQQQQQQRAQRRRGSCSPSTRCSST